VADRDEVEAEVESVALGDAGDGLEEGRSKQPRWGLSGRGCGGTSHGGLAMVEDAKEASSSITRPAVPHDLWKVNEERQSGT
jgi:hypothetical protein